MTVATCSDHNEDAKLATRHDIEPADTTSAFLLLSGIRPAVRLPRTASASSVIKKSDAACQTSSPWVYGDVTRQRADRVDDDECHHLLSCVRLLEQKLAALQEVIRIQEHWLGNSQSSEACGNGPADGLLAR
ncbi:MAG: hypothetical protein BJ554DRAFT_1469 [Olpidium bornovanus]|uniref:Uncharacterized protein n=1 Tax=Olpidium bornovanus TaxID=278681 RepID=A0A8H7ZS04_9FUNG|nr:MAG: hypothetical protein BJ554DRAFT_1469 [Olpidium bornovanus]